MGRFLGAIIMRFVKARWVFLAYLSLTVAFIAASITQRDQKGIGTFHTHTPHLPYPSINPPQSKQKPKKKKKTQANILTNTQNPI